MKLVNRRLYEDIDQYSVNCRDAIASVNKELDEFGLTSFDVENVEERSQAVAATIGVGLKWLKSDAQYGRTQVNEAARFLELAIFPEDTLENLLLTYHWLDAKLQATDIVSLIHDFDLRRDKQRHTQLSLLKHTLQMSVSMLAQDKNQLISQLYGRLRGLGEQWELFVDEAANQKRIRWLQPKAANLIRPGGNLLYTFGEHTAGVSNLLLTPAGHLVSSCGSISRDSSIKVWDLEEGVLLHSLEADSSSVRPIILSQMASSFITDEGSQLLIWNWETGEKIVQFTADGSIYSFQEADDGTIIAGDGLGRVHFLKLVNP